METNIEEIWKPLPTLERYEISNFGNVWDNGRSCLLKAHNAGSGYLGVFLNTKRGKHQTYGIHRLVLWAFWGTMSTLSRQCNHKDGNKQNNHLSNLELVTPSENVRHAWRIGLCKPHPKGAY